MIKEGIVNLRIGQKIKNGKTIVMIKFKGNP